MATAYPIQQPEERRAGFRVIRDEATTGFAMIPCDVLALADGPCIAVYAVLAKHADRDGVCWPSVQTICDALGWSRKVVEPAMKRLIEAGLVVKERRQLHGMDQSSRYRISANGRVVPTELAVVPTAPLGSSHGTSGSFPQHDEQEPRELEPKEPERVNPLPPATAKPKRDDRFETVFWPRYPKGRGSKQDAARLWDRLSEEDRDAALAALPLFAAGRDWKRGFHPAPEVWLRGRRWENPPQPDVPEANGFHLNGNGKPRGMTPEEIRAYGRGEYGREQERDGADFVDVRGSVVQRDRDPRQD